MSAPDGGNYYEYPNGVLRNRYGLQDAAALKYVEAAATLLRMAEIILLPLPGAFDLAHLQAMHRYIFQDVYTWAGELRTVDISKDSSQFAHFAYIANNATALCAQLGAEQHLQGLNAARFCERAAYYLGELNAIHPFREGNGRTQRIFLSAVAREAGYHLRWEIADPQEMVNASARSLMQGDNTGLTEIIQAILVVAQP